MASQRSRLTELSPANIRPNPDNPRLIFREEDMQVLLESIHAVGIKVPLSVYESGKTYRILDGERRWRCAKKLNMRKVPAIIQPKPGPLENLLTMFNIHNVRIDWDMIATAMKLGEVRKILVREGKDAEIADLAGLTGISKSMVRNCLELLELPKKYRDLLVSEAAKPRNEQRFTADLFIEINKSKRVIQTHAPEVFDAVAPSQYVDRMVRKYRSGGAKSVTSFRSVSKIARAERAGASRKKAMTILKDLVEDETYSIEDAFQDSVKQAYEQRDIANRADSLLRRLTAIRSKKPLSEDARESLIALRDKITEILGG